MKKTLQAFSLALCITAVGISCRSERETITIRKTDIEKSKEQSSACFIQLKDGTIKNYTSLKLVTGVLTTPYLLADGKQKIFAKQIKAYQNKDHYAISQENFVSGRKSYVAKETLPGFAIRVAKGRINVYAKKYYNGVGTVDEYFVQKGDDGKILAYTKDNMNAIAKDDDEAVAYMESKGFNINKNKKGTTAFPLQTAKPTKNK
ncbi:MAG: hypothetical protein JST81_01530 [Bacteroidetes bacterium]|nr:hypothetical protein [Bacteroidota bacterium]